MPGALVYKKAEIITQIPLFLFALNFTTNW